METPPNTIATLRAWFARHARQSAVVGGKATRDLRFWSVVLTQTAGIPCTPNEVRTALGYDARNAVADNGETNILARKHPWNMQGLCSA